MNSSGWIRSMIAANYAEEKFLKAVGDIIGKEFDKEVLILEITKDNYLISMDEYSLIIDKTMISNLKGPIGPYRLDRYILEAFMIQGIAFDKRRSQYVRYVFGIFRD